MRDNKVRAVVVVAVLVWAVLTLLADVPTSGAAWKDLLQSVLRFGSALTAAVIAAQLYEKYFWHWPIFRGWLCTVPDLRGVWRVEIQSTWRDPETKQPVGPIVGYMRVEQTETTLAMGLYTPESSSRLTAHAFSRAGTDFQLSTTYENDPDLALQSGRSRPHDGAFVLRGIGYEPQRLQGSYWTDRETAGTMILARRLMRKPLDSYEAGRKLYGD